MRVLLTGATGFLGSRLAPLLRGHEVVCLTRDAAWRPPGPWVKPLVADLMRPDSFQAEIEALRPDWCLHLAWEGLPDYSDARCRANLEASLELFEALGDAKVKRVVVAGSCWEYGDASGQVAETETPVNCGVFAATKNALRTGLESLARAAGFEYRWARVFFTYGPGQRASSLIPLCHAAYAAGRRPEIRNPTLAQDFIHADDVAEGLLALAVCEAGSGVFNIGGGAPATVGDVVNRVAAHFGQPAPFPPSSPASGFWADTALTAQATGWRAAIGLDEGIGRTLAALDRAL